MSAPGHKLKRWRYRLIGACALLLSALFTFLLLQEHRVEDPIYNGKRLSEYVAHLPQTESGLVLGLAPGELIRWRVLGSPKAAEEEAKEAIQALGRRSFPLLLEFMRWREGPLLSLTGKLPHRVTRAAGIPERRLHLHNRRHQSLTAFLILHDSRVDLAPVMPKLVELAHDPNPGVQETARLLIRMVDPEGLNELEPADESGP